MKGVDMVKKLAFSLIVSVLWLLSGSANAQFTVFDDSYSPDWKNGSWSVYVETANTYNGSAAALGRVGGVMLSTTNSQGVVISGSPILGAYINFNVTESTPGHSITNVKAQALDGALFEFDDRSIGWNYILDGVEYTDEAEVVFDTNPQTWQYFELNLSQTDYFGWPYQSRLLGDTAITSLNFSAYGNSTGAVNMLVDNISFMPITSAVPEPSSLILGLFGVGGILLKKRGKRKIVN